MEKNLIRLLGPNYSNYPKCVEWNIKVMKYLDKRKKAKALEKVEDVENGYDLYMRMLFLEKEIEKLQEYIKELETKLSTNPYTRDTFRETYGHYT